MRAIPDTAQDPQLCRKSLRFNKKEYYPINRQPSLQKSFPFDCDITMYGKNRVAIIKPDKEVLHLNLLRIIEDQNDS